MNWVDNWHCRFCGEPARGGPVCDGCREDLPWNNPACPRCALPGVTGELCAECLAAQPPMDLSLAPFVYARPIDQLIHQLKFRRVLGDVRWLSDVLAEVRRNHPAPLPDLILPVPLHRWRLWGRGYNQAAVIARHVGRRLKVPVSLHSIGHSGARVHQVGLNARARRKAVRGAFDVRLDLRDVHVALVDDVMTTGATVHEMAQAVRAAGAGRIEVWVLARTPKSDRR